MFARPSTPPARLTLADLDALVASWHGRALHGDEATRRIAAALDTVLQTRRSRARTASRVHCEVWLLATRRRCAEGARRCWAGMTARWARRDRAVGRHPSFDQPGCVMGALDPLR